MIVGVVLAAGAATRMGRPKQLMPYRGVPLLQHAVETAERSQLDRVVVVTGAYADDVEGELHTSRAVTVRNPDFRRGNMSSLECGALAVPEAGSYLLLMGDHPDVSVDVIDALVDLWRTPRLLGAPQVDQRIDDVDAHVGVIAHEEQVRTGFGHRGAVGCGDGVP